MSEWEPFGDFAWKDYFDFPTPLYVKLKVLCAPGSVDRAWEDHYAEPDDFLSPFERELKHRCEIMLGKV